MGGRIPMLNAINWNQGIDQIEKGTQVNLQGATFLGGAMSNAAQQQRGQTAQGQQMMFDGMKFFADYDQREDAARRETARLDMEKVKFEQDQKFNQEFRPLQIEEAKLMNTGRAADMSFEQQTRQQQQQKWQRDQTVQQTAEGAVVADWEKKNRKPVDTTRLLKEGAAPDQGLPPNWDQMSAEAKYAYVAAQKGIGAEEVEARKTAAEVRTKEAGAVVAETGAKYADKKERAGLAATEAGTAATRAGTERQRAETALIGVKAAEVAGQSKGFEQNQASGGRAAFVPQNDVDKKLAERQEKRFKEADEKATAFAEKQGLVNGMRSIAFRGQAPKGPDGTYSDAQISEAAEYTRSLEFANSPEGKEMASLEARFVLANKSLLGPGPVSDFDAQRLEAIAGTTGAAKDYQEWAALKANLYGNAAFKSFINRSAKDEISERKAVATALGNDLGFVDPDAQSGLFAKLAGPAAQSPEFRKKPLDAQAADAFGVTYGSGKGVQDAKPNWVPSDATAAKYRMFDDFNSGDASRTEKYRPAQQAEAFNPFVGASDTASRAFEAKTKTNFLTNAPPRADQPINNANGTVIPPGKHGNYLVTPTINGDSSAVFSTTTGQPVLATPRPVQAEEKFRGYGYAEPKAAQTKIRSVFKP